MLAITHFSSSFSPVFLPLHPGFWTNPQHICQVLLSPLSSTLGVFSRFLFANHTKFCYCNNLLNATFRLPRPYLMVILTLSKHSCIRLRNRFIFYHLWELAHVLIMHIFHCVDTTVHVPARSDSFPEYESLLLVIEEHSYAQGEIQHGFYE